MIYRLTTPLDESSARKLRIGDIVYLTGTIVTMRDQGHIRALKFIRERKPLPKNIFQGVIYHCGPVARKTGGSWHVLSCGPTTSMRMERYEPELIEEYSLRMVIGKGGMGVKTSEALKKIGSVYASFTGGAGVLASVKIKEVDDVYWLDLGIPEALWFLKVEDFGPLIVTMDAHGGDIHREVREKSSKLLRG